MESLKNTILQYINCIYPKFQLAISKNVDFMVSGWLFGCWGPLGAPPGGFRAYILVEGCSIVLTHILTTRINHKTFCCNLFEVPPSPYRTINTPNDPALACWALFYSGDQNNNFRPNAFFYAYTVFWRSFFVKQYATKRKCRSVHNLMIPDLLFDVTLIELVIAVAISRQSNSTVVASNLEARNGIEIKAPA